MIEQTIKQQLPNQFQQAEFLLEHGMIDMIVERKRLKETIGTLVRSFLIPCAFRLLDERYSPVISISTGFKNGIKLGLDTMRLLLERVGNPQRSSVLLSVEPTARDLLPR
ncbi:MAG: hypothetical protein MRJ68_11290 [Nitrospira sp.]|nr:hypothetical protein [Nitrospira sp.]